MLFEDRTKSFLFLYHFRFRARKVLKTSLYKSILLSPKFLLRISMKQSYKLTYFSPIKAIQCYIKIKIVFFLTHTSFLLSSNNSRECKMVLIILWCQIMLWIFWNWWHTLKAPFDELFSIFLNLVTTASVCMLSSCHVRVSEWIQTL